MNCGTCRFFDLNETDLQYKSGQCRCYPPMANKIYATGATESIWPIVRQTMWCGKYQPVNPVEGMETVINEPV